MVPVHFFNDELTVGVEDEIYGEAVGQFVIG